MTGGDGLLGRAIAAADPRAHRVVALGRSDLDITSDASIAAAFERFRPEAVVNAAAMTDVDGCERDPEAAHLANAVGPERLARACASAGVRLVHVSTDFVFDGTKREPYVADDEPNPISAYGRTKLAGENAVRGLVPDALVVRTSWVFGVGGKNFASRIFEFAAKSLRLKGIVDMRSLPTYAPDLAERILDLIDGGCTGTFHVTGGGEPATWFDVARVILDAGGRSDVALEPVTVAELGLPAPRPAYSAMRCLRTEALGLPPLRPWPEAAVTFAREASPARSGGTTPP